MKNVRELETYGARVSSVETMHERRYTVDDWRYDTAHCEQTETTGLHPNGSDPD